MHFRASQYCIDIQQLVDFIPNPHHPIGAQYIYTDNSAMQYNINKTNSLVTMSLDNR